jgi:hypothetical protein
VANGVISSYDVLADLLESIERFVDRLKTHTDVLPTAAADKVLVDLIVELISILSLVTRKLKQRRSREFFVVDVLPYSTRRSQMGKELFCGQGHQGGSGEARQTFARRVSEYHGSDPRTCPSRRNRKEVDQW